MAGQKYYTVGVSNKYSAFFSDNEPSSDDETILTENPTVVATEIKQTKAEFPTTEENKKVISSNNRESNRRYNASEQNGLRNDDNYRRGGGYRGRGSGFRRDDNGMPRRGGYRGRGTDYRIDDNEASRKGEYIGANDGTYYFDEIDKKVQRDSSERGRGRGRGYYEARGRREFDRQGVGRREHMKRNYGGNYNWGTEGDENKSPQESACVETNTPDSSETPVPTNGKAVTSPKEEEDQVLDFEAYQEQMKAKRNNLPNFCATYSKAKVTTNVKELEDQGYTRYTKEGVIPQSHEHVNGNSHGNDSDGERDTPKKKAMNVYEYIHSEGGRVNSLFRQNRPKRGSKEKIVKLKDAPDIKDERAFPKLGQS